MALLPSVESIILEIEKALGIKSGMSSKQKTKFTNNGLQLDNFYEKNKATIDEILTHLGLDSVAKDDAWDSIIEFWQYQLALEQRLWTYDLSKIQLTWDMLGYSFVPWLARKIAFWEIFQPLDSGMPRTDFWYLPSIRQKKTSNNKYLELPVQKVLNWLVSLLGKNKNLNDLTISIARSNSDDKTDTLYRTLFNWHSGKTLPQVDKIESIFSEDIKLEYSGCLSLDNSQTVVNKLTTIKNFIALNNISESELSLELAIPQKIIRYLINSFRGETAKETKVFINLFVERYSIPSNRTIRQRLIVARLVQYGYLELIKFLTPKVNPKSICKNENKVLQLFDIYKIVYNATVESNNESPDPNEQKILFEKKLPSIEKSTLFLGILPSSGESSCDTLSNLLNYKWGSTARHEPIKDLFAHSAETSKAHEEEVRKFLSSYLLHLNSIQELKNRFEQNKDPFKTFSICNNFEVLSLFRQQKKLPTKSLNMLFTKMAKLARSDKQKLFFLIAKMDRYVNGDLKTNKEAQQKASEIFLLIRKNPDYNTWKASALYLKARHSVCSNNFDDAIKNFDAALAACNQNNFGSLKGMIARDVFATRLANQKLIPDNHEKYYRILLRSSFFDRQSTPYNIEDISRKLYEYFWDELYKPYLDFDQLKSDTEIDLRLFLKDFLAYIGSNNNNLESVLLKHNKLKAKQLKFPQSDSVLLSLLKFNYQKQNLTQNKFQSRFFSALTIIIKKWPKQINLVDFKNQTPLILAANNGNNRLVKLLITGKANLDIQDKLGRTPLHAAIASGVSTCAHSIIDAGCNLLLTAKDGSTVLHTASKFGQIEIVRKLIKQSPLLKDIKDAYSRTPSSMIGTFIKDEFYPIYYSEMRELQRKPASKVTLIEIYLILNEKHD